MGEGTDACRASVVDREKIEAEPRPVLGFMAKIVELTCSSGHITRLTWRSPTGRGGATPTVAVPKKAAEPLTQQFSRTNSIHLASDLPFEGLLQNSSRTVGGLSGPTGRRRKSTLCFERQVNDLRQTLAKSKPDQICEPGVLAQKTGVGN
jgi:hypothetical protein